MEVKSCEGEVVKRAEALAPLTTPAIASSMAKIQPSTLDSVEPELIVPEQHQLRDGKTVSNFGAGSVQKSVGLEKLNPQANPQQMNVEEDTNQTRCATNISENNGSINTSCCSMTEGHSRDCRCIHIWKGYKGDLTYLGDGVRNRGAMYSMVKLTIDSSQQQRLFCARKWLSGSYTPRIRLENLNFKGIIDGGSFGQVWEAILKNDQQVAVKQFFEPRTNISQVAETVFKERDLLIYLKTQVKSRIVNLVGAFFHRDPFLVMELCLGDLREIKGKSTPRHYLRYAVQVLEGLKFIHEKRIWHLDVRLENILITTSNNAVLSDFGKAIVAKDKVDFMQTLNRVGVAWFTDYEGNSHCCYSAKSDIWAAACVIYEIDTGKPLMRVKDLSDPIEYAKIAQVGHKIIQGGMSFRTSLANQCVKSRCRFAKLLECMLTPSWKSRPDAAELLQSEQLCELCGLYGVNQNNLDNEVGSLKHPKLSHKREFCFFSEPGKHETYQTSLTAIYYDELEHYNLIREQAFDNQNIQVYRPISSAEISSFCQYLKSSGNLRNFLDGVKKNDPLATGILSYVRDAAFGIEDRERIFVHSSSSTTLAGSRVRYLAQEKPPTKPFSITATTTTTTAEIGVQTATFELNRRDVPLSESDFTSCPNNTDGDDSNEDKEKGNEDVGMDSQVFETNDQAWESSRANNEDFCRQNASLNHSDEEDNSKNYESGKKRAVDESSNSTHANFAAKANVDVVGVTMMTTVDRNNENCAAVIVISKQHAVDAPGQSKESRNLVTSCNPKDCAEIKNHDEASLKTKLNTTKPGVSPKLMLTEKSVDVVVEAPCVVSKPTGSMSTVKRRLFPETFNDSETNAEKKGRFLTASVSSNPRSNRVIKRGAKLNFNKTAPKLRYSELAPLPPPTLPGNAQFGINSPILNPPVLSMQSLDVSSSDKQINSKPYEKVSIKSSTAATGSASLSAEKRSKGVVRKANQTTKSSDSTKTVANKNVRTSNKTRIKNKISDDSEKKNTTEDEDSIPSQKIGGKSKCVQSTSSTSVLKNKSTISRVRGGPKKQKLQTTSESEEVLKKNKPAKKNENASKRCSIVKAGEFEPTPNIDCGMEKQKFVDPTDDFECPAKKCKFSGTRNDVTEHLEICKLVHEEAIEYYKNHGEESSGDE